jgi:hypothetical protein
VLPTLALWCRLLTPAPAAGDGIVLTVTIVPDAKDWTWVLQRPCPECGLDTQGFPRADLPAMIRGGPPASAGACC